MQRKIDLSSEALANLFTKRAVALSYRGVEFELMVASPSEEIELATACALKEKAVGKRNGLVELPFEQSLLPSVPEGDSPVEEKALDMFSAARLECTEMLSGFQDLNMSDISKMMEKRSQRLCQLDSSFVIEIAVAKKLSENAGAGLVEARILRLLPAARKRVSLDQLAAALIELEQSPLLKLLPRSASTVVDAVLQVHHVHDTSLQAQGP